jgi:hypothetical protein
MRTNPTLNIVSDPVLGGSSVALTGPATVKGKGTVTLNGTFYASGPYAGGQALQVTRTDPADPGGVALPDVTTAADGTFSVTDTLPKTDHNKAIVTYQVSWAGDGHLTASSATYSVTVKG